MLKIGTPPRKPRTPGSHNQKISHEAILSAVAVWKDAYLYQPVVEAHRDLVGRVCLVLDPRLGVVKQPAQHNGNLIERNPEIPFSHLNLGFALATLIQTPSWSSYETSWALISNVSSRE